MHNKFWEKNSVSNFDEIDNIDELEDKYLVLNLSGKKFAVELDKINEIVVLPECEPFPDMDEFDRGVFKLRDRVIRIINLRKKLGLKTFEQEDKELLDMLNDRKAEHENWITELIKAIETESEFKLTTDPHNCKFGKWLDHYKTDNIGLSFYLMQFDYPHRVIHQSADRMISEMRTKGRDSAMQSLNLLRKNEYQEILDLFDGIREYVVDSHREVAVIFNEKIDGKLFGVSADLVDSIVKIKPEEIDLPKVNNDKTILKGIGKAEKEFYSIIDVMKL